MIVLEISSMQGERRRGLVDYVDIIETG